MTEAFPVGGTWCRPLFAFLTLALTLSASESGAQTEQQDGSRPLPSAANLAPARSPTTPRPADSAKHKKSKHKKSKHKKRRPKPQQALSLSTRLGAGYLHGRKTRHFDSAALLAGLELAAWRRLGPLKLKWPLTLEHLQPLSEPLVQSRGLTDLDATFRLMKTVKLIAGAGLTGVWRPNWPDQYQPLADGTLLRTDRHSYYKRHAGAGLRVRPFARNHIRLEYDYSIKEYKQDPNFDPVERPNHLTPPNQYEHSIEATWRVYLGKHNIGLRLRLYRRHYTFTFARDRYTGSTHAGPGGPPPNPLQEYVGKIPELFAKLALWPRLSLRASFRTAFREDTFQGYYSYAEPEGRLGFDWRVTSGFRARLGLALSWRKYGPGSYMEGPSHPPLDFGIRRQDYRAKVNLELRQRLSRHFHLVLDSGVLSRETNFPDYQPGVFPANASYDIRWDYTNVQSMLLIEYGWAAD